MISNRVRRHWVLFPCRPCSFVALAGDDGEDSAHLSMLVQEAVALVSLRNAGAGLPVRPQATDFWIRGTPERKSAFAWNEIIWITLRNKRSTKWKRQTGQFPDIVLNQLYHMYLLKLIYRYKRLLGCGLCCHTVDPQTAASLLTKVDANR